MGTDWHFVERLRKKESERARARKRERGGRGKLETSFSRGDGNVYVENYKILSCFS